MHENWQKKENVLQSADSTELADSLGENHISKDYKQPNFSDKGLFNQREIESKEREEADRELDRKLLNLNSIFDEEASVKESLKISSAVLSEESKVSKAEQIKNFKIALTKDGKPPMEILRMLIQRFENEESVSVWVANWKNFMKLHDLAKTKSPQEQKVIQQFIYQADFGAENAFENTLSKISKASSLSANTKKEILEAFDGNSVTTLSQLNNQLNDLKQVRSNDLKLLKEKSDVLQSIDNEVKVLEQDLKRLDVGDSKREELEKVIEQKGVEREVIEQQVAELETSNNDEISFELRSGFIAVDKNGTRSIRLAEDDFTIKLPNNTLPFTDRKNLESINLAFAYKLLKDAGIASFIFNPSIQSEKVPARKNRKLSKLIVESLGFDASSLLSQKSIDQIKIDFGNLLTFDSFKSKEAILEGFGILDKTEGNLRRDKLKRMLLFIKEQRKTTDELLSDRLEDRIL